MPEPNKSFVQRLIDYLDRRIWAGPDASARAAGLDVQKDGWRRRIYRDPRFDRLSDEQHELYERPFRRR